MGAVKPIPVGKWPLSDILLILFIKICTAGINHADELPMIFLMNPFMTEKGTRLSKQMLQLWTNFATHG